MWHWMRQHMFANTGMKLISLALALTLYFYVFVNQERELVLEVPLSLTGMPENLTWTGEIPDAARVRFRGLGMDLLKLRTQPDLAPMIVRVGDVRPGRYQRPLVARDVRVISDLNVQVVEIVSPREVTLEFDQLLMRRLPVVPKITGRPAPGYIRFGRVIAEPESVDVGGPRQRLVAYDAVPTEPVDITGRDDIVISRAELRLPPRCEATVPDVTVRVTIEKVISRTFADLPVEVLRSGDVTLERMTPERGSVVVTGPVSLVESLSADELRLSIDALGLPPGDYTLMASVELNRTLEVDALSVEPVEPEKFEVDLE